MTTDLKNITLNTTALTLRSVTLDDADWIALRSNDYGIARMTLSIPYPQTRTDVLHFLQESLVHAQAGTDFVLAIVSHVPCGLIGLADRDNGTAELGYWLSRTEWGRGYATQAAQAVTAFGFDVLGLENITAGHFNDNPASARVLEKAGFHYTGEICHLVSRARAKETACRQMILTRAEWRADQRESTE